MGVVTNQTLVKIFKQKYGPRMFDEFALNSIVLTRDSGQNYAFYDVEKDDEDITYWINKMSLKKQGDEISRESAIIAKLLQ
jgi:hypothetical protein